MTMLVREEARRAGVLPSEAPGQAINGEAEHGRDRGWVARERAPAPESLSDERGRRPGTHPGAGVNGVPESEGEPDRTEALFASWADDDQTEDSEELARRDAEWEALKARLNENRVAAGEERLF